jgi:hypothetical protein
MSSDVIVRAHTKTIKTVQSQYTHVTPDSAAANLAPKKGGSKDTIYITHGDWLRHGCTIVVRGWITLGCFLVGFFR